MVLFKGEIMKRSSLKISALGTLVLLLEACGGGSSGGGSSSSNDINSREAVTILHSVDKSTCTSQRYYNAVTSGLPNMNSIIIEPYKNSVTCADFGKVEGETCKSSNGGIGSNEYACVLGANSGGSNTQQTSVSSYTNGYSADDIKAYSDAMDHTNEATYNYFQEQSVQQFNDDVAWSDYLADEQAGYDLYQEQYGNY